MGTLPKVENENVNEGRIAFFCPYDSIGGAGGEGCRTRVFYIAFPIFMTFTH